jgi:curved DNA-binding protein CbpA
MVATPAAAEIRALARILDELDYYELLNVPPAAPSSAIRAAYHAASRRFHPDANRHLEPDLRDPVERIAKRVTEAYAVLRDPRRRRVYDQRLSDRDGPRRMPLVEAEAEADRESQAERAGRTSNGRLYFARGNADLARGDVASAERNFRTALTFEPDNPAFRARLDETRRKAR